MQNVALDKSCFLFQVLNINVSIMHMKNTPINITIFEKNA